MNRREMLKGAAGGLVLAAAGNMAIAGSAEHHHSHGSSGNKNQGLIDAASDSVKKGQACISHGLELWSGGENKGMAICAMRVNDMIAACSAIGLLASNNSPHLPRMAKVVMDICRDCEKECRKFEKEEEICKTTADSCAACFNECKKIAA